MAVITTDNPTLDPNTQAPANPAPPSPELAALLGTDAPDARDMAAGDIHASDDLPGAPAVKGPAIDNTSPNKKTRKPAVTVSPEVAAAREALRKAEEEAKDRKAEEVARLKAEKEALIEAKKKEKEEAKAAKALERAASRAKAKEEALKAIPILAPVEPQAMPAAQVKALEGNKVSEALRTAYSSENNSELAYKKLGERFGWSVTPLIEALVLEKVWPLESEGKPWSYKKLYTAEKENGIKSWGHMVNRASERFTMLNPANIEKREKAKEEARQKAKEDAAKAASGIAKKATTRTPGVAGSAGFDVTGLTDVDLFDLAKLCVQAMPEHMRDLFVLDPEVKAALNLWEDA